MKDYIPRIKWPKNINPDYKRYIIAAKNKNKLFEFTQEEFILLINQDCNYCGTPIAKEIDKINPKGHYTKNNSVLCCKMCNTMKFIYSVDDFLKHISKIYHFNAI